VKNDTPDSGRPHLDSLDDLEDVLACLEKLARDHAPSSACGRALAIAGYAVGYAYSDAVRERFAAFVTQHDLTPKQREHLKTMGIDVPGE
jgi:hypothetical protein